MLKRQRKRRRKRKSIPWPVRGKWAQLEKILKERFKIPKWYCIEINCMGLGTSFFKQHFYYWPDPLLMEIKQITHNRKEKHEKKKKRQKINTKPIDQSYIIHYRSATKHGSDFNCIFFWKGRFSNVAEWDSSALMTIDLDNKESPRRRPEFQRGTRGEQEEGIEGEGQNGNEMDTGVGICLFFQPFDISMTGISTNDDCIEAYNDLKLNKKYRYVIFKLNDNDDEIVIDQTGDTNATYDDFTACLPSNECRYAVFDYEFDVEGQTRNKLLFVAWSPDNSRVRYKMLYSTTKSSFKKKLIGIGVEIQATDSSEIDREEVNDKVMKNVRK
ncbi:cofilin/actin-depolymerizing factor homolog-related [Anaeramoeba flamelloides]|uniref:Cofilin/actin-depolymerizing factor homolog-related n=1 Tax=Anaeramoeba flamelloides TaxID=1746091 RepID=A0ABQ8XHI6_9EUKA|nr:cofilin/actin-depolymerizing factor homolog-related [Anaeramoeba flamelloides]